MLRTRLRQFIYHLRHDIFTRDHRFLIVVAILCAVFVVSTISAMSRNWDLAQRLASVKADLALVKLEVETAELENLYYHSEEYQELSARQHLGKQLPGEHLVYLPANSVAAREKHKDATIATPVETPSNFSQWLAFLFGS